MLGKRIITAIVGIVVLVAVLLAGQGPFVILVSVAVILLSKEYARLAAYAGSAPFTAVQTVFAVGLPALLVYAGSAAVVLWTILLIGVLMLVKILDSSNAQLDRLGATFFGVFYIGLLPATLALAYDRQLGAGPIFMIFLAVWVADTSAYAVGRAVGRTPLAKELSPNKTVEGAIGSILITGLFFGLLLFWTQMTWGERVSFGVILAISGMFGDLFESALKREAGIKDSGSLLPGHGGILDRVDSLLVAAPIGYFLLSFWLG